MKTLNRVTIVGLLGHDPVIKQHGDFKLAELSIATDSRKKDSEGNLQKSADWHKVKVFSSYALDYTVSKLKKGDLVLIEGFLKTNVWKDKNEITRYDTDIVVSSQDTVCLLREAVEKQFIN